MPESPNADESRLEEIVAYLDGELSPEESARVERRLASDESYRQQLQGVERAWKALDELPMPVVDDKFSRTTMELTVRAAGAEVQEKTAALPIQRRRGRLATWLVAASAAALGFLVVRLAWQNPERMLLADLPVIDNVDVYSQIDRPDFLRLLRTELGSQLEPLAGKSADPSEGIERMHTVMQVDLRQDWLGDLDAAERTDLRSKFNRFRELPSEEQQRLRQLHEQITAATDAAELQHAMFTYHEWLRGLSPARQFELRSMPAEERVSTIGQWASDMRDDELFTLSDDELKQFVRKMRTPLHELSQTAAKQLLKSPEPRRPNRFAASFGPGLPGVLTAQFTSGVTRPGKFQTALIDAMPERTREAFQQLPPREKVQRVMTWKRQAEALQGEVPQEALEQFFAEELDAETRAELLSLPPGDMQQSLRRLYRRQPGRGFGAPGAWGRRELQEGRRGPDGRGPRDGEGRPRPDQRPPGEGPGRRGAFGPPIGPPEADAGPPGDPRGFGVRRGPPPGEREGPPPPPRPLD